MVECNPVWDTSFFSDMASFESLPVPVGIKAVKKAQRGTVGDQTSISHLLGQVSSFVKDKWRDNDVRLKPSKRFGKVFNWTEQIKMC